MRDDDLRNRTYKQNVPAYQSITQGQNSSRNNLQQAIRQTRQVQPGNELRRVLRPGDAVNKTDLQFDTVTFIFDPHNPVNTFYKTPSDYAEHPDRVKPDSILDPVWSITDTGSVGVIASTRFDVPQTPNARYATIIPDFEFDVLGGAINGSYTLKGTVEVLDFAGNTMATFVMESTIVSSASGGMAPTSASFTSDIPPSFGTSGLIDQFFAIKVTWDLVSHTLSNPFGPSDPFLGMGAVSLTLITQIPLTETPYKTVWYTEFGSVPGTVGNVISNNNSDFKTDIVWANSLDHSRKFPWHYDQSVGELFFGAGARETVRLMGRPFFWYNWLNMSTSVGAGYGVSLLDQQFEMITVDADGSDLELLDIAPAGGFAGNTLGFQLIGASSPQSVAACGFYFKMPQFKFSDGTVPSESYILDLLSPLRMWWFVEDIGPVIP